jgi:hypothetical protein
MLIERLLRNDLQSDFLSGNQTGGQVNLTKATLSDELVNFVVVQIGLKIDVLNLLKSRPVSEDRSEVLFDETKDLFVITFGLFFFEDFSIVFL